MTERQYAIGQLSVTKLTVDRSVQRALDKNRVAKIVKDFDPAALGALIVSHRADGSYHIIDGQHRMYACIAVGRDDAELDCKIFEGLSRKEEAALFRRYNNTRQVALIDRFLVRVEEGEESAVVLNDILNRHGWRAEGSKAPGAFAAIAALEGIYFGKRNGPGTTAEVCETVIQVLTEAWGHDANGARGEIVGGLGTLLLRHGAKVDLPKLAAGLGATEGGPRRFIGDVKSLRDFRHGRIHDAAAEIMVNMVNKQRRTNRLPDWRNA